MHRSGTSVLTRVINLLGADIPGTILGSAKDNPTGFWEPREVVQIDDCMLAEYKKSWHSLNVDISKSTFSMEAAHFLKENKSELMVIKDPRMCRLVRPWRYACMVAGVNPLYVIITRREEAVTQSLWKRNKIHPLHGRDLYKEHINQSMLHTEGFRRVFIKYEDLIECPMDVMSEVFYDLDVVIPETDFDPVENFINPSMNHVDLPDIPAS